MEPFANIEHMDLDIAFQEELSLFLEQKLDIEQNEKKSIH